MTGIHSTYRPADWRPLERALEHEFGTAAVDATAAFWFIGFSEGPDDVGQLRVYEHTVTRRRLALDRHGCAYRWCSEGQGLSRVDICEALVKTLL